MSSCASFEWLMKEIGFQPPRGYLVRMAKPEDIERLCTLLEVQDAFGQMALKTKLVVLMEDLMHNSLVGTLSFSWQRKYGSEQLYLSDLAVKDDHRKEALDSLLRFAQGFSMHTQCEDIALTSMDLSLFNQLEWYGFKECQSSCLLEARTSILQQPILQKQSIQMLLSEQASLASSHLAEGYTMRVLDKDDYNAFVRLFPKNRCFSSKQFDSTFEWQKKTLVVLLWLKLQDVVVLPTHEHAGVEKAINQYLHGMARVIGVQKIVAWPSHGQYAAFRVDLDFQLSKLKWFHCDPNNLLKNSPKNVTPIMLDEKDVERIKAFEKKLEAGGKYVLFSDIIGNRSAKEAANEAISLKFEIPHLFAKDQSSWRSILLYGPPGTGKTMLAQAMATKAKMNFIEITSSDILSKWFGESSKQVDALFFLPIKRSPSLSLSMKWIHCFPREIRMTKPQ